MLTRLLLIPIIGTLIILPMENLKRIKQIGLIRAVVNFGLSMFLWVRFDSGSLQYQFVEEYNTLNFCHLHIGIDGISLYFVLINNIYYTILFIS
jgi:NADH-ubiquinone oxidoreductase chain 4